MTVRELIAFLQTDSSLCSVIFSTLENLRLSEKQFSDNLSIFMNACTSTPLSDLPSVVSVLLSHQHQIRFLLRVCPIPATLKQNSEIITILTVIRKSCAPLKWASFSSSSRSPPDCSSIGSSLFEEFFSSIQQRPVLSKCYVKAKIDKPVDA